jgi:predicted CopG family antitoxin
MGQVIRISDELYKKLEAEARGFDTPANVIEKLLAFYKGSEIKPADDVGVAEEAESLEIVFHPSDEKQFKELLLQKKRAFIKMYRTDGTFEVKEWSASKFTPSSSLIGNLRSGFLRGWKVKGIFKAELSFEKS